MVNKEKLNAAITNSGLQKQYLCTQLGISKQSLHNKMNNKTEFKGQEALALKHFLKLNDQDFLAIFFAERCGNMPQSDRAAL